jgi:outer membrane lipoprotein-sorting protein
MRKIMLFLIITAVITAICGCEKADGDNYQKIQKSLMEMTAYKCESDIKYITQKGETSYSAVQYALKDGKYRVETTSPEKLKGVTIVYDGNLMWQYNPVSDSKLSVKSSGKKPQLILFTFLDNMVKSRETDVETEKPETVFEASIPGENKLEYSEKLWVNNETGLPVKMIIYDKDGNERMIVSYKSFEFNPNIDEKIFTLDNISQKE